MFEQISADYALIEPPGADTWCPTVEKEMWHRFRLMWALRHALLELRRPLPEIRALDVGCGFGRSSAALVEFGVRPGNIVGIDLREWVIDEARRRYPGIQFKAVTGLEWIDELGVFDFAMQCTVFSSIRQPQERRRLAWAIARVTRPGAVFLWWDRRRANKWAGGDELKPLSYFSDDCWTAVHWAELPTRPLLTEAVRPGALTRRLARVLQRWFGHPATHVVALFRRKDSQAA
jgi:SAM-dependent methyltransferase